MTEPLPPPYYVNKGTVYALAENERGHMVNAFHAHVTPGWVGARKVTEEQVHATALLFRASPHLLAAARKAVDWADYSIAGSGPPLVWLDELRRAIWLADGGWVCVCEAVNKADTQICPSCGLDVESQPGEDL